MFDITKRTQIATTNVENLIEMLKEYPMDASINICGSAFGYIHFDSIQNAICIDTEELEDQYE